MHDAVLANKMKYFQTTKTKMNYTICKLFKRNWLGKKVVLFIKQ